MDAFVELFEPLRGKMHAVASRLVGADDAEDAVMDTFLKAWKALPRFDGRASLSTWLYRIAYNQSLDLIRRRKFRNGRRAFGKEADAALLHATDATQPDASDALVRGEAVGEVRQAMALLPDAHRAVLLLRYADDLSYAEIAAATGVSVGTVMSRLFNAKRKLKAALEMRGTA